MPKAIPFVQGGSYFGNPRGYIPFVRDNGFTTQDGGKDAETYETVSGSVVTFETVQSAPLKSLVVTMTPQQSGSGDPTPENVRPINGYSLLTVIHTGKNVSIITSGCLSKPSWYSGTWSGTSLSGTNGLKVTRTYSQGGAGGYTLDNIKAGTYTFSADVDGSANEYRLSAAFTTDMTTPQTALSNKAMNVSGTRASMSFTLTSDAKQIYFRPVPRSFVTGYTYTIFDKIQVELNDTGTDYETPTVTSIPITIPTPPSTVYGGTLDVVSGLLTVTMANIASYNGETIGEPWVSSMDVFTPGTTPTTGAQVVYTLAESQTYQLTPTEVQQLVGQNNVWSDADSVTVEYRAD